MPHSRQAGEKMAVRFYQQKKAWKMDAFNKVFQLPDYFAPLIGIKTEVLIADLGAAAISTTGSTWPKVKVTVVPSDLLDYGYEGLLIPIEQQDMEALTYPDNHFDIVHCVNALDHTEHPNKAIEEMIRVCKPGGYVYLRHYENEAEHMRYSGFHGWNLSRDGTVWNKTNSFSLDDYGFVTEYKEEVSNTPYLFGPQVVSILSR